MARLEMSTPFSTIARRDTAEVGEETTTPRLSTATWWDLAQLFVFTAFGPVMTVINNRESPSIGTAALLVAIAFALASLIRLALIRFGLDPRGTTYAVSVATFALLNMGGLVAAFPLGRIGLIATVVVAAVLIYRLRHNRVLQFLFSWACLALAVAPLVIVAGNLMSDRGEPVEVGGEVSVPAFTSTPDVVLVVADGYGSNEVLSDLYRFDNSRFGQALAAAETPMNENMRSNYGWTKFSIPSLLQMGYVPVGTPISPAVESQLLDILGGENRLAQAMKANGYRSVYVESGWLGTQCSEEVDVCIGGPWPDETFYDIVHRSVLRDMPGLETGISFSRGAQHSMSVLESDLASYLHDDTPDFIYVHLLAPHPPLFLDESCRERASLDLAGFTVGPPGIAEPESELRRAAYIGQVECVNAQLTQAADAIAQAEAVGLFLGDHGPDQSGQLFTFSDSWTDEQKAERFGVLFAAHHPGCDYGSVATLVNVGRRLLGCLSESEVEPVADRYFDIDRRQTRPSIIELEPLEEWAQ